jgi:hypothetical protein
MVSFMPDESALLYNLIDSLQAANDSSGTGGNFAVVVQTLRINKYSLQFKLEAVIASSSSGNCSIL